jgi:DNA adenine methylase
MPILPATLCLDKEQTDTSFVRPFNSQLLKWVGNKQRFAYEIISYFPKKIGTFFEPFVGSGAVIGTLAPVKGIAGDTNKPLVDLWNTVINDPQQVSKWYSQRFNLMDYHGRENTYDKVRSSYNNVPNPADFLFISRLCYGGVIRFRKSDGHISTPCGAHYPINPKVFDKRLFEWHIRLKGTRIYNYDFEKLFEMAKEGDVIYCDPPYKDSQSILYGAQDFSLTKLFRVVKNAKDKNVYVALSIDGTKKSGNHICDVEIPNNLFKREVTVNCGKSMLKRFQSKDKTLENELVADRLLLTW